MPWYLALLWLLYAVVVLPSAFLNKVAAVMVAVRLTDQAGWILFPEWEPPLQAAIFAVGALFALKRWRSWVCLAAASLYIPAAVASLCSASGAMQTEAYWIIYGIALAQVALIPFGNDWGRGKATWDTYRRSRTIHRALKLQPC